MNQARMMSRGDFYEFCCENSSNIYMLLDTRGIIQMVSYSAFRLLGYKPDDLEGTSFFETGIVTDETAKIAAEFCSQYLLSEKKRNDHHLKMEVDVFSKSGELFFFEVQFIPVFKSEDVYGITVFARNITERRNTQEELQVTLKTSATPLM